MPHGFDWVNPGRNASCDPLVYGFHGTAAIEYLSETYDTGSSRMVSIDLLHESFIEDGWDVEPASLDAAVDVDLAAAQPASGGDKC